MVAEINEECAYESEALDEQEEGRARLADGASGRLRMETLVLT